MINKLTLEEMIATTKKINKDLFGNPDYEYFFRGSELEYPIAMYRLSSGALIIIEQVKGYEDMISLGVLKLPTDIDVSSMKEAFECLNVFDDIWQDSSVKGMLIARDRDNQYIKSFDEKLVKRYQRKGYNTKIHHDKETNYYLISKDKIYKNVLTIDVDFFFKNLAKYQPILEEIMKGELTPNQMWNVAKWKNVPIESPDMRSIEFVKKVLREKCTSADIFSIKDHDEIIKIFKEKNVFGADCINIDYHHDISYSIKTDSLDFSNWATFARNNNHIKTYSWVRQDLSEFPYYNKIVASQDSWRDFDIDDMPEIDMVVLCSSPNYVPPQYWKLSNMLIAEFNKNKENKNSESKSD